MSCRKDPFAPIQEKVAGSGYRQALVLLCEDSSLVQRDRQRFYETRALARFADGDLDGGFADVDSLESPEADPAKQRYKTGELMASAAEIIIREPERAQEALQLIDSALARDPALEARILKLLWNRGLEYMDLPGDAGYRCFAFAVRRDPQTLGRMTGYNRVYASRYGEIQAVRNQLAPWQDAVDQYRQLWKTPPRDFLDLLPYTLPEARDSLRAGWRFFLDAQNDSFRVGARIDDPPPREMLPRTIVWAR